MLNNLGIVQACVHGSLHGDPTRRLGGRSILEWVVRRVTDATRLNGVILVTCDAEPCRAIGRLAPSDVPVFVGSEGDVLARCAKALEQYPAEGVVCVRGDNLFVDPALIDRLITAAESYPDCDYAGYSLRDGRPAVFSPVRVYAEWFRASALQRANRSARTPADRADVTRYFFAHPQKFHLRLLPAPAEIDRDDVRLAVDIEEDWDHALALFEALGPEHLEWRGIARLLDHQPALRRRMAALNRRRTAASALES
ncbi:MAG: NTP transferase domain-containing protein [Thermoguttaceae bacterium]